MPNIDITTIPPLSGSERFTPDNPRFIGVFETVNNQKVARQISPSDMIPVFGFVPIQVWQENGSYVCNNTPSTVYDYVFTNAQTVVLYDTVASTFYRLVHIDRSSMVFAGLNENLGISIWTITGPNFVNRVDRTL